MKDNALEKKRARKRRTASVLVVSHDSATGAQLKQSLHSIGYDNVSSTGTHVQGLERFKNRPFSLVFFDAVPTNMPTVEFVTALRKLDENAMFIALSARPSIDQVFEILRAGARWFVVLPFTVDTVEAVINRATEGPPFTEGILEATDRNAALVGMILNSLENLTTGIRHIRSFPQSPNATANLWQEFRDAVKLAHTFAQGGDPALQDKIVDACLSRAQSAPTRLGRVRRKLQRLRDKQAEPAQKIKPTKTARSA